MVPPASHMRNFIWPITLYKMECFSICKSYLYCIVGKSVALFYFLLNLFCCPSFQYIVYFYSLYFLVFFYLFLGKVCKSIVHHQKQSKWPCTSKGLVNKRTSQQINGSIQLSLESIWALKVQLFYSLQQHNIILDTKGT